MGFVPLYDRHGSRVLNASGDFAQNLGITAIPANESVVLCLWMRGHEPDLTAGRFMGLNLDKGGTDVLAFDGTGTQVRAVIDDGVAQYVYAPYQHGADAFYAAVIDRDNTLALIYHDGVLTDSQALTNDPDLTAVLRAYMDDAGGTDGHTTWRAACMSITNGACPSAADLSAMLQKMVDPHSTFNPDLYALVGTFYSDYNPGEGLYGTTTVTDEGTNGDDLTWQGGVQVEDVRVRARTPTRIPRRTFYTLTRGRTATTGLHDFGLAAQPVVARFMMDTKAAPLPGIDYCTIQNAAGTACLYMLPSYLGRLPYAELLTTGWKQLWLGDGLKRTGDLYVIANGNVADLYCNGQHVDTVAMLSALDLSGNCLVSFRSDAGECPCRFTVWNPASIPGTLAQEIRDCAMDPETDPPSLTNKRVDLKLDSEHLPLATSTTVSNDGLGGGTLTLSAQRSLSCEEMFHGFSP